jgi:hypothetical protein
MEEKDSALKLHADKVLLFPASGVASAEAPSKLRGSTRVHWLSLLSSPHP